MARPPHTVIEPTAGWPPTPRGSKLGEMHPLRAHVQNGRLVLDEPTELPDGDIVELVPLDEVLASGGDYLDEDDRAALHRELEASVAEMKAGKLIDADDVLAELRAMR